MKVWYEHLVWISGQVLSKEISFCYVTIRPILCCISPFHHTHYQQVCKKYSNISSCNVLPIPHSQISLQRASLLAIWKNIMEKYIIYLHSSLFIHCRSFITHSHISIWLWCSYWGNKTQNEDAILCFSLNKNISCSLEKVSQTVLHVPCLLVKNWLR